MTNAAIIALLQEARVKIKGYASSDGLRLVEEAIDGLREQPEQRQTLVSFDIQGEVTVWLDQYGKVERVIPGKWSILDKIPV